MPDFMKRAKMGQLGMLMTAVTMKEMTTNVRALKISFLVPIVKVRAIWTISS